MNFTLFLILGLTPGVLADDWSDFTNNLATDLVSGYFEVWNATEFLLEAGNIDLIEAGPEFVVECMLITELKGPLDHLVR